MNPRETAREAIELFVERLEAANAIDLTAVTPNSVDTFKAQTIQEFTDRAPFTSRAPVVDYARLNEQAKLLYAAAYNRAFAEGRAAAEREMCRQHAHAMLETIKMMLLGVDEMEEVHRDLWTARATASLGKVPLMNVSDEIHQAIDAIRFSRNVNSSSPASIRAARQAIDDALEKLA